MSSTRRKFLKQCSYAAVGASILPLLRCASKQEKLNVLWLISEDTSPDLSCYGTPLVNTPNLDNLAGEGIRFTNAFATAPVCSAVRSGFMTGMYQTSIGCHQHRTWKKKPLPEPVKVLTEYFREAGYFTCNCSGLEFDKAGKTDWNFEKGDNPFDGSDWRQRKPGQPFFAQVNFRLTHRPFERDTQSPVNPDDVKVPPYYPDHPLTRRDWADYIESLQVLDRQVGQVIKRLEDDGLKDNTVVFYFGDHGRPHVRGKQWLYEGGIHIPLIIRCPGRIKSGSVTDDLVSTVDFAQTSLHLAGIEPPSHMQGQVFLGKNTKPREYIFAARDRCDETEDRIRCVRTKRYKYIRNFFPERPYTQFNAYKKRRYPALTLMEVLHKQGKLTPEQERFMAEKRPAGELYDLKNDPHELRNLTEETQHQDILKKLRLKLDEWIVETGDMGEIPEKKEDWEEHYPGRFTGWMKERGLPGDISWEDYLKYWEDRLIR